ncbi:hypothetical protein GCM10027059_33590 [Myceligenerans halotolerans]
MGMTAETRPARHRSASERGPVGRTPPTDLPARRGGPLGDRPPVPAGGSDTRHGGPADPGVGSGTERDGPVLRAHEKTAKAAHPRARAGAGAEMTETASEIATHGVNLTDFAADKVRSLLEQEGRDDLRLRVAVQPGGCSGLIYQLYFDERLLEADALRDYNGVEVVVDKMSVPYLEGATIDFADTIEKQGFTIDNPNAGSACACGGSFS